MPLARKDMIGLSLFGGPALPGLAPARRDYGYSPWMLVTTACACSYSLYICCFTALPGQARL